MNRAIETMTISRIRVPIVVSIDGATSKGTRASSERTRPPRHTIVATITDGNVTRNLRDILYFEDSFIVMNLMVEWLFGKHRRHYRA